MLSTIAVDWTASVIGWYAVCAGEAKEVLAVYVDGTAKTVTTHYTVDYALSRAGKVYTVLKFTAGNIPSATAVVTCDARGYETTGNTGSGTTAPDGRADDEPRRADAAPPHQLRRARLAEWGMVRAGLERDDRRGVVGRCVTWAEQQQLEGTDYVGGTVEPMQAWDAFNRWLDCWGFRAFWTAEGRRSAWR